MDDDGCIKLTLNEDRPNSSSMSFTSNSIEDESITLKVESSKSSSRSLLSALHKTTSATHVQESGVCASCARFDTLKGSSSCPYPVSIH